MDTFSSIQRYVQQANPVFEPLYQFNELEKRNQYVSEEFVEFIAAAKSITNGKIQNNSAELEETRLKVANELGDVLLTLILMANTMNISPNKALSISWKKLKNRFEEAIKHFNQEHSELGQELTEQQKEQLLDYYGQVLVDEETDYSLALINTTV